MYPLGAWLKISIYSYLKSYEIFLKINLHIYHELVHTEYANEKFSNRFKKSGNKTQVFINISPNIVKIIFILAFHILWTNFM